MEGFSWFNPPKECKQIPNGIEITTKDKTDFWQRTHYGFQRDDGHFLYKMIKGDFVLKADTSFTSDTIYDQCGVMARLDADNWIKASTEYETAEFSHLGSVVTSLGFSDWSTQEIPTKPNSKISYEMERKGATITIKASLDGGKYMQLRVCHLHKNPEELMVGVYACSPQREGFVCTIQNVEISQ